MLCIRMHGHCPGELPPLRAGFVIRQYNWRFTGVFDIFFFLAFFSRLLGEREVDYRVGGLVG
jgi:hypothetical protein